jgi:hypothetical protein
MNVCKQATANKERRVSVNRIARAAPVNGPSVYPIDGDLFTKAYSLKAAVLLDQRNRL